MRVLLSDTGFTVLARLGRIPKHLYQKGIYVVNGKWPEHRPGHLADEVLSAPSHHALNRIYQFMNIIQALSREHHPS